MEFAVTIEEIENEDNQKFFDETERVSDLGYQFAIYAEQSSTKTAMQNVREIANIIDTYLKGTRYRCLRRMGENQTSCRSSIAGGTAEKA